MFHMMLKRFGLTRVGWQDRPEADTAVSVQAAASLATTKLSPELYARAKAARVPAFHDTVRTFAASVGQIGHRPSADAMERARDAVPADIWAYLVALSLTEKPIPLLSDLSIGIATAEKGFIDRLTDKTYDDLDTWSAVAGRENELRNIARYTGRTIPQPIVIPTEVLNKLAERDRLRGRRRRGKPDGSDPSPT